MKFCIILLVLSASPLSLAEKANSTTFEATKEWKEIVDGQSIPAGLHVRMNLQTGKKEAKILEDSEEDHNKSEALVSVQEANLHQDTNANQKLKLNYDLKKLPNEKPALEYSPEQLKMLNKKFKAYKDIKKSYDDLRTIFKTDAEVITQLMKDYNDADETPASGTQNKMNVQLSLLESFNILVHQIDNALWFIDAGGLEKILLPNVVNQTNIMLRVQALRVLGALSQNNPKAKIKVFERNFGTHLSQILSISTNSEELRVALYALSGLLRNFPHAQLQVLSTSGMQALVSVLAKECELSVKAKAVTLINDLVVEKQLMLSTNEHLQTVLQYTELNFNEWLKSHAYCETLDALISNGLYELLEQPDTMEYFTNALENTSKLCASLWSQSPQLRHTLLTLKNRYEQSQEEFRMEVSTQIAKVLIALYDEERPHDEL